MTRFSIALLSILLLGMGLYLIPRETPHREKELAPSFQPPPDTSVAHEEPALAALPLNGIQFIDAPVADHDLAELTDKITPRGATPLPFSVLDEIAFNQAMEELHGKSSDSELRMAYAAINSALPAELGIAEHGKKLAGGDYISVTSATHDAKGRLVAKIPSSVSRESRRVLDRRHGLASGEVVATAISLSELHPSYADQVAECNWLLDRIRKGTK